MKLTLARAAVLAALFTVSFIHLCVKHNKNITKAMLLPLIIIYCIISSDKIPWLLVAALAASWLGDVLLMGQGDKWFTAGGISFMLSHFLFVAVYVSKLSFSEVKAAVVIPAAVVYLTVSAVIIRLIKPYTPKSMVIPMYIYLAANSTMNVFSLMLLTSHPGLPTAVAYTGAVLFFISDCSLFMVRNYKNGYFKSWFVVMFTYILGEFMITQGMIMIK